MDKTFANMLKITREITALEEWNYSCTTDKFSFYINNKLRGLRHELAAMRLEVNEYFFFLPE